jgi:hypothetical protein
MEDKDFMNIDSIANRGFKRLIKFVVVHHGIVAMLCILYFLLFSNKSIIISVPLLAVLLFLAICLGLISGIDKRKQIMKHILLMEKSGNETKKVNIPYYTLPIVNMLALDLLIIPLLVQNSAHIISLLIALGCNGLVICLTVKLMPHAHKYMQGDTMECKGDAGNMVYAVGAIDRLNYIIAGGALAFCGGIFSTVIQYWLPTIRKTLLSYESLYLYVLLTLFAVIIGIVLGYIQNNIQYKEIMRRTDKLAKIKRAQDDFPRYGLYTLALYTTRSFMFYLANIIFYFLLWFILLGCGAFRLSIANDFGVKSKHFTLVRYLYLLNNENFKKVWW